MVRAPGSPGDAVPGGGGQGLCCKGVRRGRGSFPECRQFPMVELMVEEPQGQQQQKNARGQKIGSCIGYLNLGGGDMAININLIED